MLKQQAELLNIQQHLSSEKKVAVPSDDPIAAATIDLMTKRINYTQQLETSRQIADGALNYEESILGSTVSVLQALRALQVQAGNGSLNEGDRQKLAGQAKGYLDQLQALANTQDSNGNYIFSGSIANAQTITINSSGQYVYNGDQNQIYQTVSSGLQVSINDNGSDIFMRIPNGNGMFTVAETATPNTGNAVASSGSVVNNAAYVADNYTLTFVLNSQNQLVTMVTGAVSGNVLPTTGNPDDAPVYTEGAAINFNGMEITVTGTPNPGDAFTTAPSSSESIFSIVAAMVANLNQPFDSSVNKAHALTQNNQLLEEIDSAMTTVLNYQSQVGTRLNQLDVAESVNKDLIDISKSTRSLLEDADMEELAVRLNLQMVYLQVAQQTFASIQGLTAFNYI